MPPLLLLLLVVGLTAAEQELTIYGGLAQISSATADANFDSFRFDKTTRAMDVCPDYYSCSSTTSRCCSSAVHPFVYQNICCTNAGMCCGGVGSEGTAMCCMEGRTCCYASLDERQCCNSPGCSGGYCSEDTYIDQGIDQTFYFERSMAINFNVHCVDLSDCQVRASAVGSSNYMALSCRHGARPTRSVYDTRQPEDVGYYTLTNPLWAKLGGIVAIDNGEFYPFYCTLESVNNVDWGTSTHAYTVSVMSCGSGCAECNDDGTCDVCADGKVKNNDGICVTCDDANCLNCASDYYCTSCSSGYELLNGMCTDENSNSAGIIIAVGVLAGVFVLAGAVICCAKSRSKKKQQARTRQQPASSQMTPIAPVVSVPPPVASSYGMAPAQAMAPPPSYNEIPPAYTSTYAEPDYVQQPQMPVSNGYAPYAQGPQSQYGYAPSAPTYEAPSAPVYSPSAPTYSPSAPPQTQYGYGQQPTNNAYYR